MECSLPTDGRRVPLSQLSQDSFRECQITLTLTDFLIIIFSGISVSVAAIMASFFLASTVHCFQRWSKGTKGDEEESEEWGGGLGLNDLQSDSELPVPDRVQTNSVTEQTPGRTRAEITWLIVSALIKCLVQTQCPQNRRIFGMKASLSMQTSRDLLVKGNSLRSCPAVEFQCCWILVSVEFPFM